MNKGIAVPPAPTFNGTDVTIRKISASTERETLWQAANALLLQAPCAGGKYLSSIRPKSVCVV